MESLLKEHTVKDLVARKQQLIQVPYTATVGDVINAFLTDDVLAYPITAPPNEWIGALGGGSSVLESDSATGLPTKQYIGVISILDVLMHFADNADNIEWALEAPVEKLVGRSIEGLNLIVLRPDTTLLDALATLSKGVHRVLVPQITPSMAGSPRASRTSEEGASEAPSNYHFLSQTDVIRFLLQHEEAFHGLLSQSVGSADVIHHSVLSIPAFMLMVDALRCMRNAAVSVAQPITAIAVVEADHATFPEAEEPMMVQGKGLKVVGTLAASHLRGATTEVLKGLPYLTVIDFLSRVSMARRFGFGAVHKDGSRRSSVNTPRTSDDGAGTSEDAPGPRAPVTCLPETPLGEVLKQALKSRTRQVWVTDSGGLLSGVITFSDVIRILRKALREER